MNITQYPAYLFANINDEQSYVENILKKQFCLTQNSNPNSQESNCFCKNCKAISNQQHAHILWLNPEQDYSTDSISIIFEKIRFALDDHEHYYFILPDAHRLSTACGNRMLKIIEEPPRGYHFIFTTNNIQSVLPTIVSRCVIEKRGETDTEQSNPLFSFFSSPEMFDPFKFELDLKKLSLTGQDAQQALYELLYFIQGKIRDQSNPNPYFELIVSQLKQKLKKPPQSGSAGLFIKSLSLSLHQAYTNEIHSNK